MIGGANLPEHSPLGASGAPRWMKCPGSVTWSNGIQDSESDFAAEGTDAHSLGEICLTADHDAWELIGVEGISREGQAALTKEMADAVQVYLDAIRQWHPDRNQGNFWIERRFHCPTLHSLFFGKSDATAYDEALRTLDVWDYKHGAGIIVEPSSPQLKYYAIGMLEDLGLWQKVDVVRLHIVQPRAFHRDGEHRIASITTDELWAWAETELFPAMMRAEVSRDTVSGEHCRFCPARSRACPQIMSDMDELEEIVELIQGKGAAALSNEEVGRFLDLLDLAKIVGKAAEETAYARLMAGIKVPGRKLGKGKSDREWKEQFEINGVTVIVENEIKAKFGKLAYTEPKLKSPAQIEKLPEGEAIVARFAFKPEAGLRVIKEGDARPAVNRDTKSMFTPVTKKGKVNG